MDYEEATDWYGHNIACAYMGAGTPIIVIDFENFNKEFNSES